MNDQSPIRIVVTGATGRMGRAVLECALRDPRFDLVSALVSAHDPSLGQPIAAGQSLVYESFLPSDCKCDVLIDFTLPAETMHWLDVCQKRGIPLVCGVTGHDEAQMVRIRESGAKIPIFLASNFSVGISALLKTLALLMARLGDGYDIEIVETHHRHKLDAPSGTVKSILREIQSRQEGSTRKTIHGRCGKTGERSPTEIGVHSVRMGDVVGIHELHFSGHGETVTLRHEAHSREAFASGALRAALWIVKQKAGIYEMSDLTRQ